MTTEQLFNKDSEYIANSYNRFKVALDHGKGSEIYDNDGKRYIDLGSGIGVNAFGVCDDVFTDAVCAQAKKLTHVSNLYYTEPQILLAEALCKKTGFKRVFFANSGAEANEGAIKTARKYSIDKYGENRNVIISLSHSFHGRTVTTLSATGQDEYHKDFMPFNDGFVFVEPNDIEELKKAAEDENVCGIMMEMIQGEGGVNVLDAEYVKKAYELACEKDLIFIVDEVQTGNGRTGKYFAFEHFGIHPDIVTTAKGLGGGLPIGAVLFSEKTMNTLTFGKHGSTFGGNPVAAAGALTVVERIDDALLGEIKEKSDYIFSELSKTPNVISLSGMGLMIGIETNKKASDVVKACMEKGVLVLTAKTKVRLLPPLNIPFDLLKEAVEILKEIIAE